MTFLITNYFYVSLRAYKSFIYYLSLGLLGNAKQFFFRVNPQLHDHGICLRLFEECIPYDFIRQPRVEKSKGIQSNIHY